MECVTLRVKDIGFTQQLIHVRRGKGQKDRVVPLPKRLTALLKEQLKKSKEIHHQDLLNGGGDVFLPDALARKYPSAAKEWKWHYAFQSGRLSVDSRSKIKSMDGHCLCITLIQDERFCVPVNRRGT